MDFEDNVLTIQCEPDRFTPMRHALVDSQADLRELCKLSELVYEPKMTIDMSAPEMAEARAQIEEIVQDLEDEDDVQAVYHSAEWQQ